MTLVPALHPRRTIPRRSSATQNHQAYAYPAPMLGLDTSQPLPGGNPGTAVRLEDLIPRSLGLQLRKGYSRWVSNLDGDVISFMQYIPADATDPPQLFAATSEGSIYDVTAHTDSSVTPVPVDAVLGGQPNGEWTSLNFVTSVGVHVMCMVNPGTGYYIYDGTAFTEITMGVGANQIDGVDPNSFTFVTVYKHRLWFIEGNSTRVWYLPVGQYAGVATALDFGSLLPLGGDLAVLINWTMDGSSGVGINSQFVVISSQGDVLVYAGNDPASVTTFGIVGRWNVGRVPVGRRFFCLYGSDVLMLSERGMCFLSELMRGNGFFQNAQVAKAVNSTLASLIVASLDTRYWQALFVPQEQLIVINFAEINAEHLQLAYEVNNKAFCTLRGIPMNVAAVFMGATYTGDLNGNVWLAFSGGSDGAVDDVAGRDLQGIVVTAFQPLGEAIRVKRFHMARASFIASAAPGVQLALNAEWKLAAPGTAPFLGAGSSLWDVALWDVATWSSESQSFESWSGVTGTGRYAALAMRVRGAPDTIFVSWAALVEQGGIL